MKKLSNLVLSFVVGFLFIANVEAATGTITVSSNASVAVVGSTFTVTVNVKSSEALGSWTFGLSYDSSYVSYQGGSALTVADYGDGVIKSSKAYTYTFKALKSGATTIKVQDASMVAWYDENMTMFTPSISNATVTIKTQAEIQASYSKDNDLKSLSVEGYEISPAFDKDTLEYSVSVPETVEQINVSAVVNDSTARVTGAGTIDISEGVNKIELVVTAQNGSTKTYTLNVDVKDLNPIEVSVDSKKYTVVKKNTLLTAPTGFTETTIKIGEEDIPAYKSEQANLTVVGLKDANGKIGMFIYDEESKSYKAYNELRNVSLTLLPIEIESVLDGFVKDTLEINGVEFEVMKSEMADEFYVVYAMNVETGDKDYYQYDKDTGAFIKYNVAFFENMNTQNKEFMLYMIALGGVAGLFFLLTIILGAKVSKLKKLFRKIAKPQSIEPTYDDKKREEKQGSLPGTEEDQVRSETGDDGEMTSESSQEENLLEDETDEDFLDIAGRKKRKKGWG